MPITEKQPWSYDATLRDRLEAYIEEHGLTHADLARKLQITPTRVTKYLNLNKPGRVPEPDMRKVEQAGRQFLNHVGRSAAFRNSLFETSATKQVAAVLKLIRRTGDIGLVYSEAGVGKTCGAQLYCQSHPNTILITATRYRRNAVAVEQMIADEIDEERPPNMRRAIWLERLLMGSERLIIVDNAHKLHATGLEWLFDFHDATLCPIGLIGNPEVLLNLRGNDQLFSRIGIVQKVSLGNDTTSIAQQLIESIVPEAAADILDEAENVLAEPGHVRTLSKQINLAVATHETARDKNWGRIFADVGKKLIKRRRPISNN